MRDVRIPLLWGMISLLGACALVVTGTSLQRDDQGTFWGGVMLLVLLLGAMGVCAWRVTARRDARIISAVRRLERQQERTHVELAALLAQLSDDLRSVSDAQRREFSEATANEFAVIKARIKATEARLLAGQEASSLMHGDGLRSLEKTVAVSMEKSRAAKGEGD